MKITDKTNEIIDKDMRIMSKTTRCPYFPLVVDHAKGIYVIDIEGNKFIDMMSSAAVMNTGHNHDRIVSAIHKQTDKFVHYTPAYMYHTPLTHLAEMLLDITPGEFEKKVAFGLSGSSSVDGALKAAKAYTGRNHIISFLRSYHGTTVGALSVSGYGPEMKRKVGTLMADIHFIPYPDSYRGCTETECIKRLQELFDTVVPAEEVAAIIYEPIQGDGGILVPEKSFYAALEKIARENGILLIADEVQTGFGRTGKMFASELFDVEPDILVMGKAIASGLPLSAIVGKKEIMDGWNAPVHWFNTAGNVISCAAAIETIKVIQEENLLENAQKVGSYMMNRFKEMKNQHPMIGDVRGEGLLIGVDIVSDRETKERAKDLTSKVCWRAWEKGMILAFFSSNVLRIEPPLTITMEEAKKAIDIIEEAISDVEKGCVPDSVLDEIKGW